MLEKVLLSSVENNQVEVIEALVVELVSFSSTQYADNALVCAFGVNPINSQIVRLLLDANANPNQYFNSRIPLLVWAAYQGNADVVKALIEAKADINVRENDLTGMTALMRAADEQRYQVVQVLLNAKAEINMESDYLALHKDGLTAVDFAHRNCPSYRYNDGVMSYCLPTCEILREAGAKIREYKSPFII
jgi:hypothetical protein